MISAYPDLGRPTEGTGEREAPPACSRADLRSQPRCGNTSATAPLGLTLPSGLPAVYDQAVLIGAGHCELSTLESAWGTLC
jgi:hypothetical protein